MGGHRGCSNISRIKIFPMFSSGLIHADDDDDEGVPSRRCLQGTHLKVWHGLCWSTHKC